MPWPPRVTGRAAKPIANAAMAANTIVIGAPNVGAAYIFHWNGSTWFQRAKLVASDTALVGAFGDSVAIDQGSYWSARPAQFPPAPPPVAPCTHSSA